MMDLPVENPPVPIPVSKRSYDEMSPTSYDTRYLRSARERYQREHWYPLLEDIIARHWADKLVLDLGCGTGYHARVATKHAQQVIGIDIAARWLAYARSHGIEVLRADLHNIPLRGATVDGVICAGIFEYTDRKRVLTEVHRVLKRSGTCAIMVPSRFSALRIPIRLFSRLLRRPYPAREPSRGEMLRLFQEARFELIENRMDDGLIFLPSFIDNLVGIRIYRIIERFFHLWGRNPWANLMLFVVRKKAD